MENDNKQIKPPVVVILGHVDHGKSSILESIKDLKITAKESGGITQHIAAYSVEHEGKIITFIDTPGHEAFSGMRKRGSRVADIAILVVAAEEGVKPQTKEAIEHIKKVGIPMIVAINKIDKPAADPERVKRDLITHDIQVESMGGKIPSVNVSAVSGQGIDEMLEMINLVAELENLRADPGAPAEGTIVESHLDKNQGITTTLIVKNGTLRVGDIIGTYSAVGKIKMIEDYLGNNIKEVLPSMPASVIGFEDFTRVGETFQTYGGLDEARNRIREEEKDSQQIEADPENILKIIIKADTLGSLEAIREVLKKIPQEKAAIQILKAETGDINDSDIKLAKVSEAMTVGFRVKINPASQKLALREKVRIAGFDVIYNLQEAVKTALHKKVSHETVRKDLGKLKVLAIFKTGKDSQIIGGRVTDGELTKGANLEVYRNEEKVGAGKITKIQKEQKEVGEAAKGTECGLLFRGDAVIEEGDELRAFSEETYKPGLD